MFHRMLAALGFAAVLAVAAPAAAAPDFQTRCEGAYEGLQLNGVLSVGRTDSAAPWRISGAFTDQNRQNRYEFEVMTHHAGGIGGFWLNGDRQKQRYAYVRLMQAGFAIRLDSGQSAEFRCA